MSPTRIRALLRRSHIATGILVGSYICSPLHANPAATLLVRLSLLPLVGLTGVAMWQQGRFARLFKSGRVDRLIPARS